MLPTPDVPKSACADKHTGQSPYRLMSNIQRDSDPVPAPLVGRYERDGTGLCRETDGLLLTQKENERYGPYLLLKDPVTGKYQYLSRLYRNGTEFEDRESDHRYRIDRDPNPRYVQVRSLGAPTRKRSGSRGR